MCEQLKVGDRCDVYNMNPEFGHLLLKDKSQTIVDRKNHEGKLIRFDFVKLKGIIEFHDTVYALPHEVKKIGTFIVKEVFTNRDPGTII